MSLLYVICVYVQVSECVIERLCKELCNRIEGHLPPCAAHRLSTVPKGSQQHWQPVTDRANFASLEKSWEKVGWHLVNLFKFNSILLHNAFLCLKKEHSIHCNYFGHLGRT